MNRSLLLAVMILLLSGCANVSVTRVANDTGSNGKALEGNESGVRFYRPAPHVLISMTPPPKGSASDEPIYAATIIMLPDFSDEYIIQWNAGAGNVQPNFGLTDGWNLTSFDAKIESRVSENITAVTGAASTFAALAQLPDAPERLQPGLYRLEIEPDGSLRLGRRVFGL